MILPAYTELSNFSTRRGGGKSTAEITISLIINNLSDPVEAINSIYQFIAGTNDICEFMVINSSKEGYKYDKLLAVFPLMRVILPREKIDITEALKIAIRESISKNILILNENYTLKSFDLNILRMYLSESSFGILIPLIVDASDNIIPGIIKGNVSNGFINTISADIVGTAISSLYPKYFCFIINRDAFISRNIELNRYRDLQFTLLELGFKIWKEGFIITQVRNFKVMYKGDITMDVIPDFSLNDYISFNLLNITDRSLLKGRRTKILLLIIKSILIFKWHKLALLFNLKHKSKKIIREILSKPVEDSAIFSIINKETR